MVWVGKDLKDHLVPSPCHGQGPLPPDQVAQSPVQPGLEHCQGGAATASLGNLGQGLTMAWITIWWQNDEHFLVEISVPQRIRLKKNQVLVKNRSITWQKQPHIPVVLQGKYSQLHFARPWALTESPAPQEQPQRRRDGPWQVSSTVSLPIETPTFVPVLTAFVCYPAVFKLLWCRTVGRISQGQKGSVIKAIFISEGWQGRKPTCLVDSGKA